MANPLIHVSQLAPKQVTRRRGEQAYDALSKHLDNGPVEIDLDGVPLLSASFLDGLISRLIRADRIVDVTFVTNQDGVVEKLGRISSIRAVPVYQGVRGEQRKQVTPRAVEPLRPVVVSSGSKENIE